MNDTKPTLADREKRVLEKEKAVISNISQRKQTVVQRFPLTFTLLGAFGLVATFYGFEHLIDQNQFLSENPVYLLGIGVGILLFTGTLYKRLG